MAGIGLAWGVVWAIAFTITGYVIGIVDPDSIPVAVGNAEMFFLLGPLGALCASGCVALARRGELASGDAPELLSR
jgi:hypothetical protein